MGAEPIHQSKVTGLYMQLPSSVKFWPLHDIKLRELSRNLSFNKYDTFHSCRHQDYLERRRNESYYVTLLKATSASTVTVRHLKCLDSSRLQSTPDLIRNQQTDSDRAHTSMQQTCGQVMVSEIMETFRTISISKMIILLHLLGLALQDNNISHNSPSNKI
jgi:hypothetical protein